MKNKLNPRKALGRPKDPIHVPRWMLTGKYIAFAILGVLAIIGGMPTITLATFSTYTTYWAAGLVVASGLAAYWSLDRSHEKYEKWAALAVTALLATWAVAAIWRAAAEGDLDRVAGAFAVVIISGLPGIRAFGLMRESK